MIRSSSRSNQEGIYSQESPATDLFDLDVYIYSIQRNNSKIESSEYRSISMKQTRYITTTVQAGNRLEIDLPNLPIGQTIEVILIIPDAPESNPRFIDRRALLKLSIEERRYILIQRFLTLKLFRSYSGKSSSSNSELSLFMNFPLSTGYFSGTNQAN